MPCEQKLILQHTGLLDFHELGIHIRFKSSFLSDGYVIEKK